MGKNASFRAINAVGTPLNQDESLCADGFAAHLNDQWQAGAHGVLVCGTMGLMQLLTEQTYRQVVAASARHCQGEREVMVGVGDAGFARTRERIRYVNDHAVSGVVVLSPYLVKFSQPELIEYFSALADASRHPLFLYDLPILTGTKLELDTVLKLARHPNIHGIKCSSALDWTQSLLKAASAGFRVIVAQADHVDALARQGVTEHLDGVFSIAPHWVTEILNAAAAGDWDAAAAAQRRMSALLKVVKQYGVFQSMTVLLNARGIPGNFAPAPMRRLTEAERDALMAEEIVDELLPSEARVGSTA